MPLWGKWLIGIILAIIGLIILVMVTPHESLPVVEHSEVIPTSNSYSFPEVGPMILIALYFIPTIFAYKSPRVAAIFIANLVFGWTIIGWFIVLIWALAEMGTAKAKQQPPPPLP